MAEVLTRELLDDALHGVHGWTTDGEQITRDVELDDAQHEQVNAEVDEISTAMDHHADISRDGETTHFVLSTHSAGGVTSLDITLASEIDNAIRNATGEQTAAPPEEVLGTHSSPESRAAESEYERPDTTGRRTAKLVAQVQGTQGQTGADDDDATADAQPEASGRPPEIARADAAESEAGRHDAAHRESWPEQSEDEVSTSSGEGTATEGRRHRQDEQEHVRDWEYEQRGGAQGVVSTGPADEGARDST